MPPLTLSLFGASGATGQALLTQALRHGHFVRAHCRASSAWTPPQGVAMVRGGFDDSAALGALVRDSDAVFVLLGARPPHRDVFCAPATRAIIEAMTTEHVPRLLCLTGAMIAPDAHHLTWPAQAMATLFGRSRPQVAADRASQEALVRESGLRWTIFKPPRLTNGLPIGPLRADATLRVGLRSFVSRAQLAACMLTAAEEGQHIGECVYLSAAV